MKISRERLISESNSTGFRAEILEKEWTQKMLEDCRKLVSPLLSFTEQETEFFDRLLDHGDLKVDLLTDDFEQITRIEQHPLLHWKALNVKSHKQRPNK